jgi:hypothetical protein
MIRISLGYMVSSFFLYFIPEKSYLAASQGLSIAKKYDSTTNNIKKKMQREKFIYLIK